jgi:signal peptidase II
MGIATERDVLKKREIYLILLILFVVLADQLTKLWIMTSLPLYGKKIIIPGFFNLVHVTNTGAAFGLLAGEHAWWRQVFFITVALVALVVIFVAYRQSKVRALMFITAVGLIAGGALGNLIDRIRFGAVVDFLDFFIKMYHWPAFNVADSAIFVGVSLFLVRTLFGSEPEEYKRKS